MTLKEAHLPACLKLTKAEGKGALKLTRRHTAILQKVRKTTPKVELKDKAVTITAQEDKGTLKLTENTANFESAKDSET